jgi:hypothetical protein
MTQNLNHYEKILSRSHSNYLAQISIEMTDANNQINDVLSKLTALGTVLVPMNLVTGMKSLAHCTAWNDSPGTVTVRSLGDECLRSRTRCSGKCGFRALPEDQLTFGELTELKMVFIDNSFFSCIRNCLRLWHISILSSKANNSVVEKGNTFVCVMQSIQSCG